MRSVQNQKIQSEHQVPVELQSLVDHDAKEKIIQSQMKIWSSHVEHLVPVELLALVDLAAIQRIARSQMKMLSSHLEHQVPMELLQVLVGPGVSVNFHLALGMIVQRRMMVLSV